VADGGGARPESMRRGDCQWPEAVVRLRGAVGKLGHSREGVGEELGTGERVEQRELGASGSAAARQRGKRREKVGVPGMGGATRRGGAVGPGPDRWTAPGSGTSAALTGDVHHARACRPDRAGERGA
jgi:hypothetical protein